MRLERRAPSFQTQRLSLIHAAVHQHALVAEVRRWRDPVTVPAPP